MQSTNQRAGKLACSQPNQRLGKLDMVSQHATETNHRLVKVGMLSHYTQSRHIIPACTAKPKLYKRGCKSPTADKLTQ